MANIFSCPFERFLNTRSVPASAPAPPGSSPSASVPRTSYFVLSSSSSLFFLLFCGCDCIIWFNESITLVRLSAIFFSGESDFLTGSFFSMAFSRWYAIQPASFSGVLYVFTFPIFHILSLPSSTMANESFGVSSGFFFLIFASRVSLKKGLILKITYRASSVITALYPRAIVFLYFASEDWITSSLSPSCGSTVYTTHFPSLLIIRSPIRCQPS